MTVITSSPTQFGKLLDLQSGALNQLITIRQVMEMSQQQKEEQVKPIKDETLSKKDLIQIEKQLIKSNKDLVDEQKATRIKLSEEAAIIAQLVSGFKTFKTPLEKLKDGLMKVENAFKNPGRSLMKSLNIGGIFNKQIARSEFIEKQKALGSEKSTKELKQDFESANKAAKEVQANEKKLAELKKKTGISSETKLAQTPEGKKLLEKREATTAEYSKYDISARLNEESNITKAPLAAIKPPTPTEAAGDSLKKEEATEEQNRIIGEQTNLLKLIEEHTRPAGAGASSKGGTEAEGGGGLLGGIGAGLGKLGKGLGEMLRAIGGGAGKGIQLFLRGLASGVALLANPASLIGLGAFTLAMMGLGKAFSYLAPLVEAIAPVLQKVADVIQNVIVKAIEKLPEIITTIGNVISGIITTISDSIVKVVDQVTTSIERLSVLDGDNMWNVAKGLAAIGGSLALFSGGNILAGLSNFANKLLAFGGDSPIEQLVKLGNQAENLEKVAVGMGKIGEAMKSFSSIDKKSMEAINDFPWVRATAFVAAGGSMQVDGSVVTRASKTNADAAAANNNSTTNSTKIVNAPTNNVTKTTQVIRPQIRNNESSYSKWQEARYA